ncbi:uncharacterized protein EV420DRAFT_1516074 [Desarmillaria tabescens]|uniref:Uncharacterized protein n=1 Tax=Armillaria tabescens TaxID=1929756 RepID=A0AA39NEV8_ARMTA|nr:uncharacterized protein EV420DRAFT_1516074 [Desarmillaria tabescens]KAK0464365.1 hypothetical protein EV420DRAFT_1516074 [Desarmillaria tabescens]
MKSSLLQAVLYGGLSCIANETNCLANSSITTLVDLADCFNNYTVRKDYYNLETYAAAQPDSAQLESWDDLITSLLYVDNNCTSVAIPPSLQDVYTISIFDSYCVLSEKYVNEMKFYDKGWGLFIVPSSRNGITRNIHLAMPHPLFDFRTPAQAVSLFNMTGARSLLISGRHRRAYNSSTDCVPSTKRTTYYKTDPTHDVKEPFSAASRAIWAWQNDNGGCPTSSCAFIQLHGKSPNTCPTDQMFLSSGLRNSTWYADDIDRPIKRIRMKLKDSFPNWNISLPSDSPCIFAATDNIFGRLVNGVEESNVCNEAATADRSTGAFVHIEQAPVATFQDAYTGWTEALLAAFDPA